MQPGDQGVGISWQFTFEACVSEPELYMSRISTPRTGKHRSKAWAELLADDICRRVISTQTGDMCGNVWAVCLRRSDAERIVSMHKKGLRQATFWQASTQKLRSSFPLPVSGLGSAAYQEQQQRVTEPVFRRLLFSTATAFFSKPEYDSSSRSQAQAMTIEEYGDTPIRNYSMAQFPDRITYVEEACRSLNCTDGLDTQESTVSSLLEQRVIERPKIQLRVYLRSQYYI